MPRIALSSKIGLALIALGGSCLLAFQWIGSYLDADGYLHEPFGLLPIGAVLLFAGGLTAAIGFVCARLRRLGARRRG